MGFWNGRKREKHVTCYRMNYSIIDVAKCDSTKTYNFSLEKMQRQRYMFYSVCSCQHEIKCSSGDGMEFNVVSRTLALAAILRLIPMLIHPEVSNLMPLFFTLSRLMKKKSRKLQQKSQLSAPFKLEYKCQCVAVCSKSTGC